MRRYLQLVVVLAIFFSAVLFRHLREPSKEPSPGGGQTSAGSQASLSLSPFPQPEATQTAAPYVTATPTPQPVSTVAVPPIGNATAATPGPVAEVTPTSPAALKPTPTSLVTPEPTLSPAVAKLPSLFDGSVFKDGAFTGASLRTHYGEMQVTVVIQSGVIEDVIILGFLDATPTSVNISTRVLPTLVAEAITKQDWDVDIISGATLTTVAFKRAMVYALRQAEAG